MCNKNIVGLGGIGAIKLVHAYDKDGSLYGTGVIDKKRAIEFLLDLTVKLLENFHQVELKQ